jgi:hypothetical protein
LGLRLRMDKRSWEKLVVSAERIGILLKAEEGL